MIENPTPGMKVEVYYRAAWFKGEIGITLAAPNGEILCNVLTAHGMKTFPASSSAIRPATSLAPLAPPCPKIDKHTLLTWGGRTQTAEEWAREPLVWLRGITLEVLLARITQSPEMGPAWTDQSALETVVLSEGVHERWQLLLNPPKGREGAEARRMRRALMEGLPPVRWDDVLADSSRVAPVPLFVLEHLRDALADEKARNLRLGKTTFELQEQRNSAEKERDEARAENAKLRLAVQHHGELSALFGWWRAAGTDAAPTTVVGCRVYNLLEKMFKGNSVP